MTSTGKSGLLEESNPGTYWLLRSNSDTYNGSTPLIWSLKNQESPFMDKEGEWITSPKVPLHNPSN